MKGKIDKAGCLYIERGGEMVEQDCPFGGGARYTERHSKSSREFAGRCSHLCPLFGEPRVMVPGAQHVAYLQIHCGGVRHFQFDSFTDERGNE